MTPDDERTRDDHRVILVGLDVDGTAGPVLTVARRLATALDAELEAVHVGAGVPTELQSLAASAGVEVVAHPGDPVGVLARRLAEPAVMAGVVGCRADGGPDPVGHVSLGLVQRAASPVAVVPPGSTVEEGPLHEVLLPLDGSRESTAAVAPAVSTLTGSGLQVTVVHVLESGQVPRFLDQPHRELAAWGREFLARQAAPDLDLVLRAGAPGTQLLEVVEDLRPDMVVLGWSQDLSPGRADTIRDLLTSSPVPLLLVPTDGADRTAGDTAGAATGGPDW